MTAMTKDFDGVRKLSLDEIDTVSGAAAPAVYYGVRAGFGAAIGAGNAIRTELQGDGLGWEDWDEVAGGALAGLGFGFIAKRWPA